MFNQAVWRLGIGIICKVEWRTQLSTVPQVYSEEHISARARILAHFIRCAWVAQCEVTVSGKWNSRCVFLCFFLFSHFFFAFKGCNSVCYSNMFGIGVIDTCYYYCVVFLLFTYLELGFMVKENIVRERMVRKPFEECEVWYPRRSMVSIYFL